MRTRVLVTNGTRAVDLYWVEHGGNDVYCGMTRVGGKRSYHGSGQIHDTFSGSRKNEVRHVPLKDLKGQFHLVSVNIGDATKYVESAKDAFEYSDRPSDAVLLIDARSIPANTQTNIAIGLVEPGNGGALAWLFSLSGDLGGLSFLTSQCMIISSVQPWVYAIVSWVTREKESQQCHTGDMQRCAGLTASIGRHNNVIHCGY